MSDLSSAQKEGVDNDLAPDTDDGRGLAKWLSEAIIRVIPVGIGVGAFYGAATTAANSAGLKDLLQLSIGLIAGVTAYTVANEIFLRRLPPRIKKDMRGLDGRIAAVNTTLGRLNQEITRQIELSQFHNVTFDVSEALTHARSLQQKATQSVWAMWTQHPYDTPLQEYYAETLAKPNVRTLRIIDAATVSIENVIDHIRASWIYLQSESYEVFMTKTADFEAMLVDHREAGIFLYPRRGDFGCCFLGSQDHRFATVTEGLFDRIRTQSAAKLPLQHDGSASPNEEALAAIRTWLAPFYET